MNYSSEYKIYHVLKNIDEERKISSNPKLVEFKFNDSVVGIGIVVGDQERKILLKLENEGAIKIHYPEIVSGIYHITENDIFKRGFVGVEIFEKFEKELSKYEKIISGIDFWKVTNPLFWIKKLSELVKGLLKKHIVIKSFIAIAFTLLAYDYLSAWQNIRSIISFVSKFFS